MSDLNLTIESGTSKRLLVKDTYPRKNIVVTATPTVPVLQEKTVTDNGIVTADAGYDGLSAVTVNVPIPEGYIIPSGTITIAQSGTHDVSAYANAVVSPDAIDQMIAYDGSVSKRVM